jgi:hypothetical protein
MSGSTDYTCDFVRDKAQEVLNVLEKLPFLRDPQWSFSFSGRVWGFVDSRRVAVLPGQLC